MLQILTANRTMFVLITKRARNMVACRRIRASTQPPAAVVNRKIIGGSINCAFCPGDRYLAITMSAENMRITMVIYTASAATNLVNQPLHRSKDQISDGIARQVSPQNQIHAARGEVDRARSQYSSMRSPTSASRNDTGKIDSRIQQSRIGGE